ncbi:MAG: hypothetical protein GX306_07220 [Clostridiales bacterium]|jgi:hypothetical protein|nr:hypothetical protein [Clostridiales bacterium]
MSETINLNTFPSGKASALTMLYLEKQDLSGISPEELAEKYTEIYERIDKRLKDIKKSNR